MIYGLLADLTLLIHFLFIVYVVLGGVLSWRWRKNIWFHLPAAAWGVVVEMFAWICPLTHLENWLLVQSGKQGYDTDFIIQYLQPIIYPSGLTPTIQWQLAFVVVGLNLLIYMPLYTRWFRRQKKND